MTALTFATEFLTYDLWDEASPLLIAHYAEIAHFRDITLAPDVALYLAMADQGLIRVYTARLEARLVGYALFFVRHNPHYATSLQAVQDVVYLAPTVRGTAGVRFLRYCESQLRDVEHVAAVYHHVKAAHDTFGRVLERDGYQLVDYIYAKRLTPPDTQDA